MTSDLRPAMLWPPLRVRFLYGTLYFNSRRRSGQDLALDVQLAQGNCKAYFILLIIYILYIVLRCDLRYTLKGFVVFVCLSV